MKEYMQKMGRSLMLPVATLPVAALFTGIGYWIDPTGWGANNVLAAFMIQAGQTILNNLGLLFAVGLAFGMSKDKDGSAALAGVVSFLVPMTLLNPDSVALLQRIDVEKVNTAFTKINNGNVFIGILAGLIAAAVYNKFSNTKLPMALSFFSGRRLVPILTAVIMAALSAVLLFLWPAVFGGLTTFGKAIVNLGPLGAGIYGFSNRLLIPTGMHHALNNVFWFDAAGINDIGNFWKNIGTQGITGRYQAGFFPIMMFGLPAGAYAIYRNARPEKKKATASLMLAAGFASFFTGVTEPLEFSFMFVAWPLYVVHAVLTGISMFIAALFHWTAGFNFSAGLIDFILSLRVPIANQPYMLLVLGLVMAVVYYFTFDFVIKKFNMMTPGREEGGEGEEEPDLSSTDEKFAFLAGRIYQGLGNDNLKTVDNCTTRLRLTVENSDLVDQAAIKATGVPGVRVLDKKNVQVIVGTEVQFVADELKKIQQTGEVPDHIVATTKEVVLADTKAFTQEIFAVATGKVMPITEVPDQVFSAQMMGDGFAILPTKEEVFAPISGKITNIFPTKHAMGIQTESGLEVLLHMGLDTVELIGEPFKLTVSEGQVLKKGDKIADMDLQKIKAAGKGTEIIVAFTNAERVENINLTKTGNVIANLVIGQVTSK
ncbi:N-acetylglucosamine-specific PTS transporter subunit IIBC [Lactococcus petauri]|uniref:N-acetylglucosamine-specific PTS transporter subunit IIBC n=1 Tax=Lactococcus petauri TaxID=1940789 RepID=A0ABZ2SF16_9LACT|nr:N-acetylglucosamine-specific PTS transporter subunit IIBC [Lactococcus petauri]OAL08760.1 N-acetylglucosamine-specific PTS system IIABC component [Lactococcus garvieae]MCI3871563.1 N-acetylglucosamine-specific PTS transporter subunit IIBC [Lactococcus petauri]MCQ8275912.1 PTS system N-acetylglucosamine-specific EIICBA component [Lactococcus petauri]MCR6589495.1 N-acetylglucosamine-specific PTS transporter subunit IIBC [Lactococcus petauri]MCU7364090.1 N-acetylglucosamine-specific PTS transp